MRNPKKLNVLERIEKLNEQHIWMKPEYRLASTLWILHAHVYDRYNLTPRLALLSPTYGCGKSEMIKFIQRFVPSKRYINLTTALLYRVLDEDNPYSSLAVMMDEADMAGLMGNKDIRSVLNGNQKGDYVGRATPDGGYRDYSTYKPIVYAGTALGGTRIVPIPLIERSVIIRMQKPPPNITLEKVEFMDEKIVDALCADIQHWAKNCKLNRNPPNPLRLRGADNWRSLLAIADDFGRGSDARKVAELIGLSSENPTILLLIDIKVIFDTLKVDRITSAELLTRLFELPNSLWREWCGPHENLRPRKLTPQELARMLTGFGIRSKTVWSLGGRKERGPSHMGHYRKDIEEVWIAYCPQYTHHHTNTHL
jgi:hypothetical protein